MTMHVDIQRETRYLDRRNTPTRALNLALQGAGTHGAFGWGILDKLLEDGRIDIAGIAATSTGAINAVLYAYGTMRGGNDHARALLEQFWRATSEKAAWLSPIGRRPFAMMYAPMEPLLCLWLESLGQILGPYDLNPLNTNPMRDLLRELIDFEELHRFRTVQLSLTATNVRTGMPRVFSNRAIDVDAVLAAACLPTVSQSVEIDGEFYWDGAYCGQSTIAPLLATTTCRDVLLGQISPVGGRNVPRRATEIQARINDIALHTSVQREAAHLAALASIDDEWIKPEYRDKISRVRLHSIRSSDFLSDLTLSSRLDTNWQFLSRLRDMGRLAAELWLDANFERIGICSTVDFCPIEGSLPC